MTEAPKSTGLSNARSMVVKVPKAADMVTQALRREIVTGRLLEGDALPTESVLMEKFGVSRPTLREAFRVLESERLIHVKRGMRGGARVLIPDAKTVATTTGTLLQYRGVALRDVYEAWCYIEEAAVGILARTRSADNLVTLRKMLSVGADLIQDPADPIAFAEHDLNLHGLLIKLAGNQTMQVFFESLRLIVDHHNEQFLLDHENEVADIGNLRAAQRAHTRVVELIAAGDQDAVTTFWRRHLAKASGFVLRDPEEKVSFA